VVVIVLVVPMVVELLLLLLLVVVEWSGSKIYADNSVFDWQMDGVVASGEPARRMRNLTSLKVTSDLMPKNTHPIYTQQNCSQRSGNFRMPLIGRSCVASRGLRGRSQRGVSLAGN